MQLNGPGGRVGHTELAIGDSLIMLADEAAGAKLGRPVETKFYGDRMGTIADPFGHVWHVSTHVEDIPPEEIERRAAALSK